MRKCRTGKALVVLSFLVILCSVSGVLATTPDWMIRPGTIRHALLLEDGSHVYLDAVIVDKIKAKQEDPYFTIHECFDSSDRIIVLTPPSPELRLIQLVDVEGTLTTLDNGCRAIVNPTVYGYTDKDGTLLRHGPLVKGIFHPTPWEWKVNLTVNSTDASMASSASTAAVASSEEPNDSPAEPPSYYPTIADVLEGNTAAAEEPATESREMHIESFYDGIPDIEGLPDGSFVELQCKRIIGVGTENINGTDYHYIDIAEDLPATDWIRTYCTKDASTTDRVNRITGQVRYVDIDTPVICVDTGPGYDWQDPGEGQLQTAAEGTIAWARTLADGTTLPTALEDKVVSRAYPSVGYFYIQELMRESGIRIYNQSMAQIVQPGNTVTVSGTISSQDGERMLTPNSVTITGTTDQPRTLGLNNRSLGGGEFNVYTPGITGSFGMLNVGLLVRVQGRVTYVGTNYFYLDDGSNIDNGESNPRGVKVSCGWQGSQDGNPPIAVPAEDWYVCVNGISSSEISSGQTVRVLRLRRQEDLQIVTPSDSSYPCLTMTTPSDGEIHIASGQTTAQLVGTATDPDTGITSVQVGFTNTGIETPPTAWNNASYDAVSHVWTYDWQNPQTQRVWIRATDFAMHTTTIYPDITVSSVTVIYVKTNGSDSNNGSSWALAKATVTVGLAAAISGNEVWVAGGTYVERITLKSGVGLYGGFGGTEVYREQRYWNANETILDGNQVGIVVTSPSGATATTVIDGFTIQNGKATGGGGIYCSSSSPMISNNIIKDNIGNEYGGGIYCYNSSPTIMNNTISGNSSLHYYGGGIYCASSPAKIANNIIANNNVAGAYNQGDGGGICCINCEPMISNNTIIGNSARHNGGGIFCNYSLVISNNTIVGNNANAGGGISCASSTTISNNILAFNSSGIYKSSGTPVLRNNDVYSNTAYDYSGLNPGTGDISVDPKFVDRTNGDYHICADSPCRDAGYNEAVQSGWVDLDGHPRIMPLGGVVDIGADEITEIFISLTPTTVVVPLSSTTTLTAKVFDPITGQPISGRRVDFTASAGLITFISPDGHINDPAVSGWGTTSTDGTVMITVSVPSHLMAIIVTASSPTIVSSAVAQSTIYVGQSHVGFLYSICNTQTRDYTDQYLTHVANKYGNVVYDRLEDIQSGIDSSYNVVFVVLPTRNLTSSELNALSEFIQSGREKRVVLIGEYNHYDQTYRVYNIKLNNIAAAIGMNTRFSIDYGGVYDNDVIPARLCEVNSSHYLMSDVTNLCDAATDKFQDGWEAYAQPLAYICQLDTEPWILEEDTITAGSRIAIHDSSLMSEEYLPGNIYYPDFDLDQKMNFKFVHNLCFIFSQ